MSSGVVSNELPMTVDSESDDDAVGRALAALAGVLAWVGWFSVSPALGLPSLGPAAMFNRVLAPRADSGYWLGWAFLFLALTVAIVVYFGAVRRGLWRAGIVSGLVYGAVGWLVAGAVVMPLLGLADPFPVPAPPALPDAMHGTLMMLHLGPGAPLSALIAWLVLGAVLGATGDWQPAYSRRTWALLYGTVAAVALLVAVANMLPSATAPPPTATGTRTLASGPVAALPEGPVFISVFRLPQPAGAVFGPHAHVPGFTCTVRGVATMTFADSPTMRLGPGQAGFMGAQQVHTHINADDRVPAGAIAVLLVVAAAVLAFTALRRRPASARLMPAMLLALAVLGGLAAWNPWSNDWFFISVRPAAARGGPMPLPSASRVFESADLLPLPPGPYTETVDEVTIAAGQQMAIQTPGASLLLVIGGEARIRLAGGTETLVGEHQAALLQPRSTTDIAAGERGVRLFHFAVAPGPAGRAPG